MYYNNYKGHQFPTEKHEKLQNPKLKITEEN
jgi:hypothetical protein